MFERDDHVYYASGGVCRVTDICYAPLAGMPADRQYYVLRSLHDPSGVIYVPVNSDSVFLRRLLTREEAEALLARLSPLMSAMFRETNPAPLKYALSRLGLITGEMRLPMWD